jgi:hypothetical protein
MEGSMSRRNLLFALISALLLAGCSTGAPPPAPAHDAVRAAYNTAPAAIPATQPALATSAPASANLAAEFDAELLRLLNNEPAAASSAALPPDERQLIASVIESLSRFRQALRDSGNSMMATRVAPLIDLSDRIRAHTPLNLPTLAICKSVTQFGAYEEFEPVRFPAGKESPTIVYCEVENFQSRQGDPGRWETKLSYEAALFPADSPTAVFTKKPAPVVDECRNRRRDFFLADRLNLPADLPVGQYLLKVTVIDQLANHVAEKSVPITIAAN